MKVAKFVFNMFSVNTYVIWNENTLDALIIDPGMINADDEKTFSDFVSENKLNITGIINTHFHIDHTFGCDYVKSRYNVPVSGHRADLILASRRAEQARMFGLSNNIGPLLIDNELNEGDILNLGDEKIHILHVPGHSPGSLVYYIPESGIILSGDVLFRQSIGRTDLVQGDYNQLINGISSKLLTLPAETVVLPGHGPATTIGDETTHNPYL